MKFGLKYFQKSVLQCWLHTRNTQGRILLFFSNGLADEIDLLFVYRNRSCSEIQTAFVSSIYSLEIALAQG